MEGLVLTLQDASPPPQASLEGQPLIPNQECRWGAGALFLSLLGRDIWQVCSTAQEATRGSGFWVA